MRKRSILLLVVSACVIAAAPAIHAQETTVVLDLQQTKVTFVLEASLHTVHGSFKLKSGSISFDPSSGAATGSFVIDAASGETGNGSRDKDMKKDVLETERFPEIAFTAHYVHGGPLPANGASQVEVTGVLKLHGSDHELTLAVSLKTEGPVVYADTHFTVPYVQWGMKNPSNFLLRVSKQVEIEIHAVGRVQQPAVH